MKEDMKMWPSESTVALISIYQEHSQLNNNNDDNDLVAGF